MAVGRRARAVAAVVAAALLGACTSAPTPDPAPTPTEAETTAEEEGLAGDRVAVVIAPDTSVASGEAAALLRAARDLRDAPTPGVVEVRVSPASTEAFARDLANLAVDDGFDLVCVVGTGTAELVLELARARRDARFCTTDGRISGGPVNLTAVALDPAALVEAGSVAIGTAPAPVGLLLSEQVGDPEALTSAFTSAVPPPRRPSPTPEEAPTEDPDPTATEAEPPPTPPGSSVPPPPFVTLATGAGRSSQAAAGEELAAQRPSRALVLATPGGAGAAQAAGANGSELVVVSEWTVDDEGELPPGLLVSLTVDWETILRAAVATALGEDPPQVQLLGIADELLAAVPGQVAGGDAAADRVTEYLRAATE